MKYNTDEALICMSVEAMPVPPVSSRRANCVICRTHVWVATTSRKTAAPHCMACVRELFDLATDEIEPLTKAQVKEIRKVLLS